MIKIIPVILLAFAVAACKSSISANELYGKWKYIKVENPKANPPDSVTESELKMQAPYIQFSNNKLVIMWGGKILSHGTFRMDGRNIRYKESLEDGTTREFPFWVSKLTDNDLVFETTGVDGSRVTAVRSY
jgi:hypothetical protein